MKFWLLLLSLVLAAPAAMAEWQLAADQSNLSFVSLKNVDVAEAHRFTGLSGTLAADGSFHLEISADSVDTKIPIRDERVREQVLKAAAFPFVKVRGRVDPLEFAELGIGQAAFLEIEAELEFRDQLSSLLVPVRVSRVGADALEVVSVTPVLLSARNLGVSDGVDALRRIAGLESISMAVPVYFSLRFARID